VIDMVNIEAYLILQYTFKNKMDNYSTLIMIICISVFVFSLPITLMITINAVKIMTSRLSILNRLKYQIFYDLNEILNLDLEMSVEKCVKLIKRITSGELLEIEKFYFIEYDRFYEQIIVIIVETKIKLERFFENLDNGTY
jgi:hypothetical protein